MAKMSIMFNGFGVLAEAIDKQGGDLRKAVDDALTETQLHIQQELDTAASAYASKNKAHPYAEGDMYRAILKNQQIVWRGNVGEIKVGFDFKAKHGWHSIFVMYGTPRSLHPIKKDQKLWNAVWGARTKKDIAKIQSDTMRKYLNLGGD